MKSRLEIENFSGKSCLAIAQDFYAKIFSCNLTSILVTGADEKVRQICEKRKKTYKPNFTQALNRMKNSIVLLFCREKAIVEDYLDELVGLFAANLELVDITLRNMPLISVFVCQWFHFKMCHSG